jgi:hypothetical protein
MSRGVQSSVAQDLGDFRQRGALLKHRSRQAVTQKMRSSARARGLNAGAIQGAVHHLGQSCASYGQWAMRRQGPDKEVSAGTAWAAFLEIGCYRLANFVRQGHSVHTTALAANKEFPGIPTNIFQLEAKHFPDSKAQPGQNEQNGVVT